MTWKFEFISHTLWFVLFYGQWETAYGECYCESCEEDRANGEI